MNLVSLFNFHLVPWIATIAVVLAVLCAAFLLGSVVLGGAATIPGAADGPLTAPFRWAPLARGLA